jgi:hypothetical protein
LAARMTSVYLESTSSRSFSIFGSIIMLVVPSRSLT